MNTTSTQNKPHDVPVVLSDDPSFVKLGSAHGDEITVQPISKSVYKAKIEREILLQHAKRDDAGYGDKKDYQRVTFTLSPDIHDKLKLAIEERKKTTKKPQASAVIQEALNVYFAILEDIATNGKEPEVHIALRANDVDPSTDPTWRT